MGRFGKRDDLVVHQREPFNAETGLQSLTDPVTPTDAFYVRGHGAVPEIDPEDWRLRVHGLVEHELSLSMETLRDGFRERTVTATLQCAGNRRAGLVAIRDIPGEAPWGPGATGTATWTGCRARRRARARGPARRRDRRGVRGSGPVSGGKARAAVRRLDPAR